MIAKEFPPERNLTTVIFWVSRSVLSFQRRRLQKINWKQKCAPSHRRAWWRGLNYPGCLLVWECFNKFPGGVKAYPKKLDNNKKSCPESVVGSPKYAGNYANNRWEKRF